jgi:DNA-directed RNA polymerase subunit RPC12/RpoP/Ca2+-binding EF-hand superfamily protein
MIKCSKCGKENVDDAIFCADCGNKLVNDPSDLSTDIETADSDSDSIWSLFKIRKVDESESFSARFKRHPTLYVCCVFPLIFILVISIASDANLFIKGLHPADYETTYPDEFNNLDFNDDGKLEFNEVNHIVSHTPQDMLYDLFRKSDKDENGYLTGYEFDVYQSKANGNVYEADYRRSMEEMERNASKHKGGRDYSSGNSKATNSLNKQESDRKEGYVLTCPYCGSESIYEIDGYYRCAECGNSIYDPDDLELGYVEGYMELLVPISSY